MPQHNIGKRTDVMEACPKAEGMMMMIRSMSPEVIVVDEIGSKEDVFAILEAIHAGVSIICSVHGHSLDEKKNRDRKSTRLNSSHVAISYAVFCLKKKNKRQNREASIAHDSCETQ